MRGMLLFGLSSIVSLNLKHNVVVTTMGGFFGDGDKCVQNTPYRIPNQIIV